MRTLVALIALSLVGLCVSGADALAGSHGGHVFIGQGLGFQNRGFVFQNRGLVFQHRPVIVPRSRAFVIERCFAQRPFFVRRPIIVERPFIIEREFFVSPFCPFP